MKSVQSKDLLAANLRIWAESAGLVSSHEVAAKLDLPQKTVYNMLHGETNPYKSLDQLAEQMRVPAWQLLYPRQDDGLLTMLRAYQKTTDEGRRLLVMAAQTAARLSK